MDIVSIVVIAIGLSMDTFSVSIVSGLVYKQLGVRHILRMALFFGAFQAVMPIIGWLSGLAFRQYIHYDHWVAFGILAVVGCKMIYEAFKTKQLEQRLDPTNLLVLLTLSVATSIDALAVGVTLSLLTDFIIVAVVIIGSVTFVLSYAGVYIGKRFSHFSENKIEIAGGIVLIGIGIKILVEHLIKGPS